MIYAMLLIIIAISLILFALGIKLIYFKRAGYKNVKRYYTSFVKWYNNKNIWEVQGIKPRTFMKVSNVFNIILWVGAYLLFYCLINF